MVTSVYVKNPGNDSEVTPEGVAGKTESVDAPVCSKPVEPLNFDEFNSAKDLKVCNNLIIQIRMTSKT